ncbi:hypothetical protein N7462_006089 [Penicillium macrosclerotiorum]|uniref:uncharacterized protein n=1 Tax=Penicillium macrosclerotiorum TaxID=303699 RepID=UPI0025475FD0|nr:uncharacterized protein N7462_006089 [Penicillium macrosclerotiorum]KAJ5682924.1 hypothetical protein N7462_006089 [Penicillium macrosclerotiorum]
MSETIGDMQTWTQAMEHPMAFKKKAQRRDRKHPEDDMAIKMMTLWLIKDPVKKQTKTGKEGFE